MKSKTEWVITLCVIALCAIVVLEFGQDFATAIIKIIDLIRSLF